MSGNTAVVGPTAGTTYRLASVPAVSRLNAQFTGPPLATIRKPVQVTHSHTKAFRLNVVLVVDFLLVYILFTDIFLFKSKLNFTSLECVGKIFSVLYELFSNGRDFL